MPSDTTPDGPVFAIVEQMGHRRFGARVRDVTRFGAACMEAVVLLPGEREMLTYVFPSSLFAVTVCTEEQARRANAYGCLGLPALDAGRSDEGGDGDGDVGNVGSCDGCGAGPREPCKPGCRVGLDLDGDKHDEGDDGACDDGGADPRDPCKPGCDECGAGPRDPCKPGCPEGHRFRHPEEG